MTEQIIGRTSEAVTSEPLKEFVRHYGYGSILLTSLLVLWWCVAGGYEFAIISNALYITVLFVIAGLEVWIPYQKSWGNVRTATRADVIYFLLAAPIDGLHVFLVVTVLAGTAQYHEYIRVVEFWPTHYPILVQLLFVTLIADFFKYWYHRWTHEVPFLWRYHSIHHSLERLEMLRASYFYPIDIFLTVALGSFAMLAFGVPSEIIIFHNVFAGITGLLNHSNADLHCGIFDHIFNSIGHHRAHHAVSEPGCSSNYGSFFNFVDRIFGTRYLPDDQSDFGPLGLNDQYEMPETFLKQLAVPFQWRRIYRGK